MVIEYSGTYTEDEVIKIRNFSTGTDRHMRTRDRTFLFIIGIILLIVSLVLRDNSQRVVCAFSGFLFFALAGLWHLLLKRQQKLYKALRTTVSGTVDEDAVTIISGETEDRLEWSYFSEYRSDEELLLLYLPQGKVIAFPHRFFTSEKDWESMIGLAKSHLKQAISHTRSRVVNILLALIITIIVFALIIIQILK